MKRSLQHKMFSDVWHAMEETDRFTLCMFHDTQTVVVVQEEATPYNTNCPECGDALKAHDYQVLKRRVAFLESQVNCLHAKRGRKK